MVLIRKVEPITAEEVLSRISEYDIYHYECPEFTLGVAFCNWMRGEKNPSLTIFLGQDGKLHHFDQGDSTYRGDCWDLVQQKYSIGPREAIDHVAKTFMLIDGPVEAYRTITSQYAKPLMLQQRHSLIQCTVRKWTKETLKYWEQYGITIEDLKAEEVYPVREWSLNRRKQYIAEGELCYAYRYTDGYKIYYPGRPKETKWKSNISTSLVENTKVISENDRIIITKAKKCRMYLSRLLPGVINVQNETRSGFSDELIEMLKDKQVYVQYDSDAAGKKNSMVLTKELGYKHLNCPDVLLNEGVKDFSDWRAKRGSDDEIVNYLKSKGIMI